MKLSIYPRKISNTSDPLEDFTMNTNTKVKNLPK